MSEPFENLYFNWLYSKIGGVSVHSPSLRSTKLLSLLHRLEFLWIVQGDDNRAEDGVELRTEYLTVSREEPDDHWLRETCSVLEMLIAFSRRAGFETDEPPRAWFWRMIDNLGLSEFNDANPPDPAVVVEVIETFVWRHYAYNGLGGLFPLRHPRSDQREVEIWYQFSEYLYELETG